MEKKINNINYINFNQDQSKKFYKKGLISVGTDTGFSIFLAYPFCKAFSRDLEAGISNVQILNRCNFITLVGGGSNPKYPSNKVMLWDDQQQNCVGEIGFSSKVKNVIFRDQMIFVVLEDIIFQFNLFDLNLQVKFETGDNPLGLCSVYIEDKNLLIVYPDNKVGDVRIVKNQKQIIINAHYHELQYLQLNENGNLLATASVQGTIIKIINTENGDIIRQLRRGTNHSLIQSICFDKNNSFVCCSSDSGTIHIFKINEEKNEEVQNKTHSLSFMKGVIPYLGDQWSFARVNILDKKSHVAFTSELNMIIAVTQEGNFYKIKFNNDGSDCRIIQKQNIFQENAI